MNVDTTILLGAVAENTANIKRLAAIIEKQDTVNRRTVKLIAALVEELAKKESS